MELFESRLKSQNTIINHAGEVAHVEPLQPMPALRQLPEEHSQIAIDEFDSEAIEAAVQAAVQTAVLVKNALILMKHREYILALNLLRNLLMRFPNHPMGLRLMGMCFRERSHFAESIKCFKALVQVQPTIENQLSLAETYYQSAKDDAALTIYQNVLSIPGIAECLSFEALKNMGNIHVRKRDFDNAEECYNRAYTLNPNSDALLVNYGTLEIQREDFNESVSRFREAIKLNSSNDKAWVGLALVHRHMGDIELSRANIERALDINPDNQTALSLFVEWALESRDYSAAICSLQSYLCRHCEVVEYSFLLAKIYTHVGRIGEALIEMERVLVLGPEIPGAIELKKALDQVNV